MLSCATSLPWWMISTRWHTMLTSGRMWLESRMVRFSPSCLISARVCATWIGSMPMVGSSRINTLGSWMIDWARPTRCRKPLDSLARITSRYSCKAQISITSSTRRAVVFWSSPRRRPAKRRYPRVVMS